MFGYTKIRLTYLYLLSILLLGCGSNGVEHNTNEVIQKTSSSVIEKPVFNAGDLFPHINCIGDPSLSFALYIPQSYTAGAKMPVLLLFDPKGDGTYPLTKYKKLADYYGYILVGSNDSKNGNSGQLTGHILEELMRSVGSTINADSARIYAGGFSGGARVAAVLGLSPAGIQGLALCGAGFPSDQWNGAPPSVIVAMAGNTDMNLSEILTVTPKQEFKGRYQVIRFNGKHEWPAEDVFETAFMAFESYAMRDNLRAKNEKILKHIDDRFRQSTAELNVSGRMIENKLIYEAWIKDLEGLSPIDNIKKTYNDMVSRPQFIMTSKNEIATLQQELMLKNVLREAIGTKDTAWWWNTVQSMQADINNSKDRQKSEMVQRAQGYVSLSLYSAINQAMLTDPNNKDLLFYLTTLYQIADSHNSESWYLSAIAAAKRGDEVRAINFLNRSVDEGFTDIQRFQSESTFQQMRVGQELEKLADRMRKK